MDPDISVIVGAHRFRPYLAQALHSLANQTISRERFEVVVVLGFSDPASDALIARLGFRTVRMDDPQEPLGAMYARGIRASRGRLVGFLEDDDMYTPRRLEAVLDAFEGDPTLTYFCNRYIDIDEENFRVGPGVGAPPLESRTYLGAEPRTLSDVRATISRAHPGSTSNTVLTRTALDPALSVMDRVQVGNDQCLFLTGLASGGALWFDPRCLTLYRVHSGQSGEYHPVLTSGYLRWKAMRADRGLADCQAFLDEFLGRYPVGAREYLDANLSIRTLEALVYAPSVDRIAIARVLPKVLRAYLDLRASWYGVRFGWGATAIIWPGLAYRYDHSRYVRAHDRYEANRAKARRTQG